jgi:hypothetical protein
MRREMDKYEATGCGEKVYSLLTILVLLTSVLVWSRPAFACDCAPPEAPPTAFAKADAVFIGTVTRITDLSQVPFLHELVRFVHPVLDFHHDLLYDEVVHLKVNHSWKGVETTYVRIRTEIGGCGEHFAPGNEYLVYAYEQDGILYTHMCTRTRDTVDAIDDLVYLQTIQELELTPETSSLRLWPVPICLGCVTALWVVIWLVRRKIRSCPVNGRI